MPSSSATLLQSALRPKDDVRAMVWGAMEDAKVGRFPFPLRNRIPNFVGAEAAAQRLVESEAYKRAKFLKCCPDSPQIPVRRRALQDGKVVFMAVPRLAQEQCFIKLDPSRLNGDVLRHAATIKGAFEHGRPISPGEMPPIDLVVAGSVGIRAADGARIGKGRGYSDVEFGIASELGLIGEVPATTVATTVHDVQVLEGSENVWPIEPYDIPVDYVFTPTRTIHIQRKGARDNSNPAAIEQRHSRPAGIYWNILSDGMRNAIPVLRSMRGSTTRGCTSSKDLAVAEDEGTDCQEPGKRRRQDSAPLQLAADENASEVRSTRRIVSKKNRVQR